VTFDGLRAMNCSSCWTRRASRVGGRELFEWRRRPSHVLAAMGVSRDRARGSLRLSMGAETTTDDVDAVIRILSASCTLCALGRERRVDWQTRAVKVLVAMSGGVDSSVAAGLLIEQGHEVVGATLKLWGGVSDSGCCSVADVDDARRVAQMLGIDHHVFNYTDEFERHVVAPFVEGHARPVSESLH